MRRDRKNRTKTSYTAARLQCTLTLTQIFSPVQPCRTHLPRSLLACSMHPTLLLALISSIWASGNAMSAIPRWHIHSRWSHAAYMIIQDFVPESLDQSCAVVSKAHSIIWCYLFFVYPKHGQQEEKPYRIHTFACSWPSPTDRANSSTVKFTPRVIPENAPTHQGRKPAQPIGLPAAKGCAWIYPSTGCAKPAPCTQNLIPNSFEREIT